MADETKDTKDTKKEAGGEPKKEAAAKKDEPRRIPASPPFSKLGLLILGAVVILEGGAFLLFLSSGSRGAPAEASGSGESGESGGESGYERDLENFFKESRSVLDLGEIEVPISSNQPRSPRSIVTSVRVVLSEELMMKFAKGGGHGGGGKDNPQKRVLELNIRSIISGMLATEGMRLLEGAARSDFQRKARDRLNNVQVDMDEETARVLKILRGKVLQVIIEIPKPQAY